MSYLIINADDFGYSKVFNEVILDLIESDLVTATSVMVNRINDDQKDQFTKLIGLSQNHNCSIGLHAEKMSEDFKNDILDQANKFFQIFNFKPEHIDLHIPGFRFDEYLTNYYPEVINFAAKNNIPCKNWEKYSNDAMMTKSTTFDGTAKNIEEIKKWLFSLEPNSINVAVFHPGKYDINSKSSVNKVREVDASNLRYLNPILKEMNIKLVSFKVFGK